jgi:hypothetical protein
MDFVEPIKKRLLIFLLLFGVPVSVFSQDLNLPDPRTFDVRTVQAVYGCLPQLDDRRLKIRLQGIRKLESLGPSANDVLRYAYAVSIPSVRKNQRDQVPASEVFQVQNARVLRGLMAAMVRRKTPHLLPMILLKARSFPDDRHAYELDFLGEVLDTQPLDQVAAAFQAALPAFFDQVFDPKYPSIDAYLNADPWNPLTKLYVGFVDRMALGLWKKILESVEKPPKGNPLLELKSDGLGVYAKFGEMAFLHLEKMLSLVPGSNSNTYLGDFPYLLPFLDPLTWAQIHKASHREAVEDTLKVVGLGTWGYLTNLNIHPGRLKIHAYLPVFALALLRLFSHDRAEALFDLQTDQLMQIAILEGYEDFSGAQNPLPLHLGVQRHIKMLLLQVHDWVNEYTASISSGVYKHF